jgi:hypothetical protein
VTQESTALIEALPRRVAHAAYAVIAAAKVGGEYGPFTAAEVCIYDEEAMSVKGTAAALREAQKRQLAMYVPGGEGYWTATNYALDNWTALQDRFLRDTGQDDD